MGHLVSMIFQVLVDIFGEAIYGAISNSNVIYYSKLQ